MPTGDKHVDIYNKQLVPQQGWDQYFFRYLDEKVNAATRSAFLTSGVLSDKEIGLGSTANDTFSADLTDASRGVDDIGHIMDLANLRTEDYEEIPFENALGITYYVGFRYQAVPSGIERNPRSSEPEYPYELDTIGELGEPDSVTDNTTYIRLELDGLLEAGVDHSGRLVRVYLDNPVSPVEAVAYYDGTVSYGTTNYVDIPYTPTAGPLGQTAPTYPISTTASDYRVHVYGLSWFRNTDISTDGTYVFLGTVQGSGAGTTPTVFDTTGQIKAFLISLQRAYYGNSTDDPAPGRSIWAHRGSVYLRQNAASSYDQDGANALLWFDKKDEDLPISLSFLTLWGNDNSFAQIHDASLRSVNDGVGNNLQELEAATISGDTITLTRAGADLTAFDDIWGDTGFVFLENTTGGTYDGLYIKSGTVTATTMQVIGLDLAAPTFPADTCQVRFFVPQWIHFFSDPFGSTFTGGGQTQKLVPRTGEGFDLNMYGSPTDVDQNWFIRASNRDGGAALWFNLFPGKMAMTGGGVNLNGKSYYGQEVHGNAHYLSDKRTLVGTETGYRPDENEGEWGYDYRGTDFDKYATTDEPGHQLAGTFRQPLTAYDGGTQPLISEEPFTSTAVNILNFTRAGFDNYFVPAFTGGTGGRSWILAEVQFDTPHSTDGIYFVSSQSGGTALAFQTIDGLNPGFPTSQTGKARFYGGAFFGTHDAAYGGASGWVQTIVPPTPLSGGLRIIFDGEDNIASTAYKWGMLIQGYGAAQQMWGVRDGGVMYSRAMTTRAWEAGHELTQWDMVDTAYVNTDLVLSDLYTGTKAEIGEISLEVSPSLVRYITVDATSNPLDFIKYHGLVSSGSFGRAQSMFPGIDSRTSAGAHLFELASDLRGVQAITPSGGRERYAFKLNIAQGATLDNVRIRGNPGIGDGTSNAMGFAVYRQDHGSGSSASLMGGGFSRWSAGNLVTATVSYTITSGNPINNALYDYYVVLETSAPSGATTTDQWYWCSSDQTVTGVGANLWLGN